MPAQPISFDDFMQVEMRAGTILSVKPNPKARKPAYILEIDFGEEMGTRVSSAQITDLYEQNSLVGNQVIAVVNFPPLRVAGIKSEALVLGLVDASGGVVLLRPERPVANGLRVA